MIIAQLHDVGDMITKRLTLIKRNAKLIDLLNWVSLPSTKTPVYRSSWMIDDWQ